MKAKLTLLSAITILLAIVAITGTGFADEVKSVSPSTSPSCPPNNKAPNISVSDTSVFLCSRSDSVRIHVLASDPDGDQIKVEKISGIGTFSPKNQLSPISAIFSFHADTAGIYSFIFRVTDEHGATDEDTALVTITYNLPPQLTCPSTQSHHKNGNYTVSQVVAEDFDGTISAISAYFTGTGVANLTLTNIHGMGTNRVTADFNYNVTNHCAAGGFVYVIGTDNCGAKDTCFFGINLTNTAPAIICPSNGTVHSGATFVSTNFTASDPDDDVPTVTYLSMTPCDGNNPTIVGNHVEWVTTCNEKGDYIIRLLATDPCGYRDTCEFTVNVYNQPPVLTCPSNGSVHAGQKFTSTNFSVTDPENDLTTVTFLGITPGATNNPTVVNSHVEWNTTCAEKGTYTIRLVATDNCGAKDTCEFTVNVYNQPPVLTCPNNGSVHAGHRFTSSNFSYTDPESDPVTVSFLNITPPVTYDPYKVNNHIEWLTTCAEKGTYIIRLVATDNCGAKDTCEFTVDVYNQPPSLTCPASDSINAGDKFYSTDYSVSDADDPTGVTVTLNSISPTPTYAPTLVNKHVEWRTSCNDLNHGPTYTITLVASDPCGAKDTCQFTVKVYNHPPVITCPEDDSIHAGGHFISTNFTTSDPKCETITVNLCGISPSPVNQPNLVQHHIEWQTACADAGKIFTICLVATDTCGSKDTCYFHVTVYNQPPQLTCPNDGNIRAGNKFTSTNFSITDLDGDITSVNFLDITPPATNSPVIVGSHVEWLTTCAEKGDYIIRLVANDPCGAKDTCEFKVNVYNQPPVLTCPSDDSVQAGQKLISADYSATDPENDLASVGILSISPSATNNPTMVGNHVEWLTTCAEKGNYVISLVAADSCGAKDTCQFTVKVYHLPPNITCPENDSVHAGEHFVSTNFSVFQPKSLPVDVILCGIVPTPVNQPSIVSSHVEWQTGCADAGKTFIICLLATDSCGAKDTCNFSVSVYNRPPQLTCPENDSIKTGDQFVSTNYSVTDPDDPSGVVVTIGSISPAPVESPVIVGNHIEWHTRCADLTSGPNFVFTLIATDPCGAKDTCHFTVTVYNPPPVITCPEDDSIHAGSRFVSKNFTTSDPKSEPVTVTLCGITPTPTNQPSIVSEHVEWLTACTDAGKVFTICLLATDSCGAKDTCYFNVTVYNRPPQLTCPNDGIINATQTFVSTNFSVIDLDGDTDPVTFLDITPPATNNPTIVGSHVEWVTTPSEYGNYIIRLVTTDPCGLKDTCQFKVTVYNEGTSVLDCPENDSVHAGIKFVSTNYSVTGPGANPDSVRIISITPSPSHQPVKVLYHVELQTECSDAGKVFTICLESKDNYGDYDTCCFEVTVYNRPPQLTCPNNDTTAAGYTFVSTNFSGTDPDSDLVTVSLLGISPPTAHNPTIVGHHVEWLTNCDERGDHVISLVATDPCGLKDTCMFIVNVVCGQPPEIKSCPNDGHTNAGLTFVSSDFIVSNPYGGPVTMSILDIKPTPHGHLPCIVGDHVEWITHILDEGDYFIRLLASDNCGNKDTCEFKVNLYNCHNPNFDITVSPDTQYVIAGQTAGFGVKLTRYFWMSKPCTLTVSGLPQPGGSGIFNRAVLLPTDSTLLNIFTSIHTDTGSYNVKIKAWTLTGPYSDYVEHEITFLLRVLDPIDVGDQTDNPNTPNGFALYQNHPNPFNPETQISYLLPKACQVKLTIYNVLGQSVRVLYDDYQDAGIQTLTWDGRGKDGTILSSGVYFYRLVAGDFAETKKMSFLK